MAKNAEEPLRGEAAWRAARIAIAKKNDAVSERARKNRASRDATANARRLEDEHADLVNAQRAHGDRPAPGA